MEKRIIKWTTVRAFGKVKYFRISYVVLLIVPILFELHHKAAEGWAFFDKPDGSFLPLVGTGISYACWEISLGGKGSGCENLQAPNDHVALTKCSMIAGNRNWFGGVTKQGKCP